MNVKQYFNMLNIMHIALLVGQLFFIAIVLFLFQSGSWKAPMVEEKNIFLIIAAIATAGGFIAGNFVYNKQLESIKLLDDFKEQFSKLKVSIIMRFALLEGPMFVTVLFYMLTEDWMFMVFAVLIIMLFLKLKPNKEQIISEMELSDELKKLLENPDTIIDYKINK